MSLLLAVALQDCRECHFEQDELEQASIHAKRGIDCASCHGTDVFDPSKVNPHTFAPTFTGRPRDRVAFCAKCHEGPAGAFRESAHLRSGLDCLACHASHGTEPARIAKIEAACRNCHGRGDPHADAVDEVRDVLLFARDVGPRLSKRMEGIADLEKIPGVSTSGARQAFDLAVFHASELPVQQHAMNVEAMRKGAAGIRELEEAGGRQLEEARAAVRRRPLWLAVFLVLLLAAGGLAVVRLRRS